MANIGKIIGDRIKVYRTKLGYSQEFLAEKAGLHPTYIGQIERAETNTSINNYNENCYCFRHTT